MDLCWTASAALFLLFAAASCAPVEPGLRDAYAKVSRSSLALNHAVKELYVKAQNESGYVNRFPISPAWMEADDMCDPKALRRTSAPCVGKMLRVLKSYRAVMEELSRLRRCLEFDSKIKAAIKELDKDMSKCVTRRAGAQQQRHGDAGIPTDQMFAEDVLCLTVLERLFSFSILTARVFAVGDPARHADGSTQKCM